MAKKLSYDDIPPDTIIICPKCNSKNPKANQYCENCREDLSPAKLDILNDLGRTDNKGNEGVLVCSFCGATNPRATIFCHNCANSFKKSFWAYKRTEEDLRERQLETVVILLVLGGILFPQGIWLNNYGAGLFGLVSIGMAFFMFLRRRLVYPLRGKSPEAPPATGNPLQPKSTLDWNGRPAVHPRRRSMMATRVGTALVIFGLLTFAGAFFLFNSNRSATAIIPGGDYISFHTHHPLIDSHLSGSYSVSPGSVSFYIFTSDQFRSYSTTGFVGCLYQSYASSGSFSVNLTGAGTYYIVAEHSRDPSVRSTDQSLRLTYSFSGILLDDLILGIGVLALGVPLVFIGRRIRSKVRKSTAETTH